MATERQRIGDRLLFAVDAIVEERGEMEKLRKEFFAAFGPFIGEYFNGESSVTISGNGDVDMHYHPPKD